MFAQHRLVATFEHAFEALLLCSSRAKIAGLSCLFFLRKSVAVHGITLSVLGFSSVFCDSLAWIRPTTWSVCRLFAAQPDVVKAVLEAMTSRAVKASRLYQIVSDYGLFLLPRLDVIPFVLFPAAM